MTVIFLCFILLNEILSFFHIACCILWRKQWLHLENNRAKCAECGIHTKMPLFVNKRNPRIITVGTKSGQWTLNWIMRLEKVPKPIALQNKNEKLLRNNPTELRMLLPKSRLEHVLIKGLRLWLPDLILTSTNTHFRRCGEEGMQNDGSHQSKHRCFHLFFIRSILLL